MRAKWQLAILTTVCTAFGAMMACSSGGSGGSHPSTDAGKDGPALDAVQESPVEAGDGGVEAGPDAQLVGCVPRPVDGGFEFIPPKARRDVCTKAQLQAFYNACDIGSASSCNAFYNNPANSPCILCVTSNSTDPEWGAVVAYPDSTTYPNIGGCMELVAPNAGPGDCAQAVEAFQTCVEDSCQPGCPPGDTTAGFNQIASCEDQAGKTTCFKETQATDPCGNVPAFAPCIFASYEAAFLGLGQFFCAAAPEGGVDAAPYSTTPDAADGGAGAAPDGGVDASVE